MAALDIGDKQGDQIGQNFAKSLIVYVLWVDFWNLQK
jgi:hypothetical protein